MPILYLLHFIKINNYNPPKKLAILCRKNMRVFDKLINDELTGQLLYHGLIIDYVNGLNQYVISDENYNYIISNHTNKDKIQFILKNNSIYFYNKQKNVIKEIANLHYDLDVSNIYNDIYFF